MARLVYTTDCEGPTCVNDNAYEICEAFLPDGGEFFNKISLYDDVVYLMSSKGEMSTGVDYGAGYTLKLILPFLKAYGLTDRIAEIFSEKLQKILFLEDAKKTHKYIERMGIPIFEISTSYRFFARAVSKALNIPYKNVFCTEVRLDRYPATKSESERLRQLHDEIVELPDIHVPAVDFTLKDLDSDTWHTVERLNHIFWKEISQMPIGELFKDVKVVDAYQKAAAVRESMYREGAKVEDVVYVGDSITDVEALRYVGQGGGIAISFNGDRYAINESDIACIGESPLGLVALVEVCSREGSPGVMDVADNWSSDTLKEHDVSEELIRELFSNGRDFAVRTINDENRESLIQRGESKAKSLKAKLTEYHRETAVY